jgi:hypothetical protein
MGFQGNKAYVCESAETRKTGQFAKEDEGEVNYFLHNTKLLNHVIRDRWIL